MVPIAEFTVPARAFPLGAVFADLPGVTVELERVVPADGGPVPYLWVSGATDEDVTAAADGHPIVESLALEEAIDGCGLYRAAWSERVPGVLQGVVESGLTVLSARGDEESWQFRFRAATREEIGEFRAYCREHDVPVRMVRVHTLAVADATEEYGVTPRQREAMLLALHLGYFDEPRRATLSDVADELGISRQAVAARLRRGHRRLLEGTLDAGAESRALDGSPDGH